MHLHTLEFSAVGPFAETHVIDFDHLTVAGLFLLEGPTGAGKSTVIDAITFALFGKVAGEHASDDRLRSAHANPRAETYVDLTFETISGVYRVRRSPAYERPKVRGTGTTTQQAAVKLWRFGTADAETGDLLATRMDEASREIERIIGLTRAQFVQTVVLPQGEFAAFLRAKPEDRTALLQRVFGTEIYDLVQSELAEWSRAAKRAVDEQRVLLRSEVAEVVGGLGSFADEPHPAVTLDDDLPGSDSSEGLVQQSVRETLQEMAESEGPEEAGLPEFMDSLHARLGQDLADCTADVEAERAVTDKARAAFDAANIARQAAERRDALRAELAALDAREPVIAVDRERHETARRAEPLRPLITGVSQAERTAADAGLALDEARCALPIHLSGPTADLPARRDEIRSLVTRLEAAAGTAQTAERRRADAESDLAEATESRAELAKVEAHVARVPERRTELTGLRDTHARRASQADVLTTRLHRAQEIAEAARDVQGLTIKLAAAEKAVDAAEKNATEARNAHADARSTSDALPRRRAALEEERAPHAGAAASKGEVDEQLKAARKAARAAHQAADLTGSFEERTGEVAARRQEAGAAVDAETAARRAQIAGMAGELAATLKPGVPCQVCGATEHPAPATVSDPHAVEDPDGTIGDDALSAAERVEAAAQARAEKQQALESAVEAQQEVQKQLAVANETSGGASSQDADDAVAALAERKREIAKAISQCDQFTTQIAALDEQAQQAQDDADQAFGLVEKAGAELEEARHARTACAERLDARREAANSTTVEDALAAVSELEQDLASAQAADEARDQAVSALAELEADESGYTSRIRALGDDIAASESRRVEALRTADDLHHQVVQTLTESRDILPGSDDAEVTADVVEQRHAAAVALTDQMSAVIDAERDAETATTHLRARHKELDAEAAARSFSSVEAATAALLDAAELDRIAGDLRGHDQERHRVETNLADPSFADLRDPDDLDLDALRRAAEEAGSALAAVEGRRVQVQGWADAAGRRAQAVLRQLAALTEARAHAVPAARMAQVTAGDRNANQLAVTLATFVLMRRFEEVVDAANARLRIMSNARFELERSDQHEQRSGRRLGLALRVLDHHTETARDPSTLSGGETFYVSLCLALGLADVVTAEAGGVDLGTLFIDEGFGSLDPETLDVVVAELARLRESGRTVGVVSHVESMKSVIPERIRVRRSGRGSTLDVIAS